MRGELDSTVVEGGIFCTPGAEMLDAFRASFRVWAPTQRKVSLVVSDDVSMERTTVLSLKPAQHGWFEGEFPDMREGLFYRYRLKSGDFPDPASRFQPLGPHGPSQIVNARQFRWTDQDWKGLPRENQVLYEMHIGTFTREGTWKAACRQLPQLKDLGVTTLEIMPVADFPGRYGWGYDGVSLYAPTRLYGTPDDFRVFVDCAHEYGIGIILDVVYNHFGPDGNHLKEFSADYFTDRYANDWGAAINFDGENCGPVRDFFTANAAYWIRDFHLDGLRLDATQQIYDSLSPHILSEISKATRKAGGDRRVFLVAENEPQERRLLQDIGTGGFDIDAVWNDDFHHAAIVALTGKSEAYYTDYRGAPQEFISAAKYGYLYQGQYYSWQKNRRGTSCLDLDASRFVHFIQNHDQIANSLRGRRIHAASDPGSVRAMTALLLLGPATPMLFQGQEFASSAPFLYFADHTPELAKMVADGRREFLKQFPSLAQPAAGEALDDPENEETFQRCKLDFSDIEKHRDVYLLHRDLMELRRTDPVINGQTRTRVDGAILEREAFILRYFGQDGDDRLLVINLGRQVYLEPMPEPLLAHPDGAQWTQRWCSEEIHYGGESAAPLDMETSWRVPGRTAILLTAVFESEAAGAK